MGIRFVFFLVLSIYINREITNLNSPIQRQEKERKRERERERERERQRARDRERERDRGIET